MPRKKYPVTVADVARAAKVSKATAARVIGGYGVASEKTRKNVTEAAKALGYHSNELARSMSTGRTGLIGVVVGDIENAFFSRAVRGISDVAKLAGLNVVITNSNENLAQEKEMVDLLMRQRVAGMIVAPTNSDDVLHLESAIASGTPIVTLDRISKTLLADAVCGDDTAGTAEVMRYLHDLGHRQIAYVTAAESPEGQILDLDLVGISAVKERIQTFSDHARDIGIDEPLDLVFANAVSDDFTANIVDTILTRKPRITAILASDSLVGASVYETLRRRNVRIPDEMSFVSWFDSDWARLTSPPVSVVNQPTYNFGKIAMERLIKRIDGDSSKIQHMKIPTPFIERASTAAKSMT